MKGAAPFAKAFQKQGARDHAGRSLRELDHGAYVPLPCSLIIYSAAFDGVPAMVLDGFYRRLCEVLTEADQMPVYNRLTTADLK